MALARLRSSAVLPGAQVPGMMKLMSNPFNVHVGQTALGVGVLDAVGDGLDGQVLDAALEGPLGARTAGVDIGVGLVPGHPVVGLGG